MQTTGAALLARWINKHRLSQVAAAKRIGVDNVSISLILAGKRRPGLDNAIKIQKVTGIAVDAWELKEPE